MNEDERWLLSYYRSSEISGSLFFGRLAQVLKPGPIQHDLSKHFADEAQHAWYWTDCMAQMDAKPLKLSEAYQDQYLEAAGVPANLMEVMAITLVFERRVINQYAKHLALPGLAPPIAHTIGKIMEDEKWHVSWVSDALRDMGDRYGADNVKSTLERFKAADKEVYAKTLGEHEERLSFLFAKRDAKLEDLHATDNKEDQQ